MRAGEGQGRNRPRGWWRASQRRTIGSCHSHLQARGATSNQGLREQQWPAAPATTPPATCGCTTASGWSACCAAPAASGPAAKFRWRRWCSMPAGVASAGGATAATTARIPSAMRSWWRLPRPAACWAIGE
ncbi:putative tRNA-specific adenosine deaminase [Cyanobium sp. NS01]|nr:putative tRNA-specific adenosine deaminase [Cyanobium sp. NS01]